jgi:hypothetical protein
MPPLSPPRSLCSCAQILALQKQMASRDAMMLDGMMQSSNTTSTSTTTTTGGNITTSSGGGTVALQQAQQQVCLCAPIIDNE